MACSTVQAAVEDRRGTRRLAVLVVTDNGRAFAGVPNTVSVGRPDGLTARAAQMIGDVSAKPVQ